mmetsp:Transcript_69819/g.157815  ORF Transcript_69819/g.157815 Transcript_69819/m.157815 type:complete len:208 (-) Transcript_69819:2633-3256(-)
MAAAVASARAPASCSQEWNRAEANRARRLRPERHALTLAAAAPGPRAARARASRGPRAAQTSDGLDGSTTAIGAAIGAATAPPFASPSASPPAAPPRIFERLASSWRDAPSPPRPRRHALQDHSPPLGVSGCGAPSPRPAVRGCRAPPLSSLLPGAASSGSVGGGGVFPGRWQRRSSLCTAMSDATTGQPQLKASARGRPNPSSRLR